jgi:hypothetical protein
MRLTTFDPWNQMLLGASQSSLLEAGVEFQSTRDVNCFVEDV